jgi:hypothetical protein
MDTLAAFIDVPHSATSEEITKLVNYKAMCLRRKRDCELKQYEL